MRTKQCYSVGVKKNTRTQASDELIRENLKEPDRYAFEETPDERFIVPEGDEEQERHTSLFKMTDAALEGRLLYYEREHLFARDQNTKRLATFDISRTKAEITRRKAEKRTDAVIDALVAPMGRPTPEAVNDAEANWQRVTKLAA